MPEEHLKCYHCNRGSFFRFKNDGNLYCHYCHKEIDFKRFKDSSLYLFICTNPKADIRKKFTQNLYILCPIFDMNTGCTNCMYYKRKNKVKCVRKPNWEMSHGIKENAEFVVSLEDNGNSD